MSPERARGLHLAVLCLGLAAWTVIGLVALARVPGAPDAIVALARFLGSCPSRALSGDPCPLCGTITATLAMLSGDWRGSMELNPLAAFLLPTGIVQPVYRAIRLARPRFRLFEEVVIAICGVLGGLALVAGF